MHRKTNYNAVLGIIMFFCVTRAFADTYWVSPTGSAAWADARSMSPLEGAAAASVSTMNSNVSAGDTVYFREGIYDFTRQYGSHINMTQTNGTPGNMIVLSSYGTESVILRGTYGTRMWGLTIQESSYIKIHGLIFVDYSDYLIRAGAHHIEISHCTFKNETSPYQEGGFSMVESSIGGQTVDQPVSHIWIHNSVFYKLEAGGASCTDEGGDALRIGYHSNTSYGGTTAEGLNSHITIENNYMAYSGHAVFENYGIYTIVRNNVSHNEPWYPENPGPCNPNNPASYTNSNYDGLYSHRNWQITDTFGREWSYNLYEGNRIGHAGVNPNNDGATNLTIAAPGNIVRYNALYNAMHNNMKTKYGENYGWQASGGCRNKIYNNTLYVSGYGFPTFENSYPWPRPMRGFRYYAPHDNPENVFKNNIVYGSYAGDHGEDDIQSNTSNPPSIEINNWTTNNGNGSTGYGDPLFINPDLTQTTSKTLPDLRLHSNSPVIDGGAYLTMAAGSGSGSTTLVVNDAFYFQDGTWGCDLAGHKADWIAIGAIDNIVQISSIDYAAKTIYLAAAKTWSDRAEIWLFKKSDGEKVLSGSAPDYGAYEFDGGYTPDNIIAAASCSLQDVQAAVDSAVSGDTILLPPGNAPWESTLYIPNNKKLTIKGSGNDQSVISTEGNSAGTLISMGTSGSRITGIGFILSTTNAGGVFCDGNGWRVDHCRFDNITSNFTTAVSATGYYNDGSCPTGVVDHCEFFNARVLVMGDASLMANKIWAEPLGLGTDNAVFVEDCVFNFTMHGNAIDANYGGRYVFRYNELTDVYIEAHSVQGTHRATRSWEIYGNKIHQKNRGMWAPFFLRGGTGVVFDNELTGEWSSGPTIIVDNVRSFREAGEGGLADGSSPWDGNEEPNGYPARDQIGRSTDSWLWTDSNPYPPQEFEPFYQWNNTHNGSPISVYVHNNCDIHIQENRDYYNNVERPGYQPYEYPHPLAAEDPTTADDKDDETLRQITDYRLSQNYPNPFNPATTIKYSIPVNSIQYTVDSRQHRESRIQNSVNVSLVVYDILGKEVATLVNEPHRPGNYEVTWDASNFPSGVYFYQLRAGNFMQAKKLMLIK